MSWLYLALPHIHSIQTPTHYVRRYHPQYAIECTKVRILAGTHRYRHTNTIHPHCPSVHCPTLCHLQEVVPLRDEHTGRVCADPVCVDGAGLTGGGGSPAEKSENMHTHICTYMHPHPLHGVPTSIPMLDKNTEHRDAHTDSWIRTHRPLTCCFP